MAQSKMKIFLAGIPTEPDVRALMERFNDYVPGNEVLYADIAEVIHVDDVRSYRFETVLSAWRKRIRKEENVTFKRLGDRIRFLAEMERVQEGAAAYRQGAKKQIRAYGDIAMVRIEMLDELGRKKADHIRRVMEKHLESQRGAVKEIAETLRPPKQLPRIVK
jgi:hypothetical protein